MGGKVIDKSYGSIPHLSTSKMGQQADKRIEMGQEKILTSKARDWHDLIIVSEKIDGSNVGITNKDGRIVPIIRSGYDAEHSNYEQHKYFSQWAHSNSAMFDWLPISWRVCGEWCIQAHGTIYDISDESPFVAFDIIDDTNNRILFLDFIKLCSKFNISMVPILHIGQPLSIEHGKKLMGEGHYGKATPEGFVYRCERNGKVEFLAKWVRADKDDGKYLDEVRWNIGAERYVNGR